jgi:hypothetical protein
MVKRCVETLPFTSEGYNWAKSILLDKFGKESEIINSYVREILELPYITSVNPRKVAEFSEKLSYCVQTLDSMKKLEPVRGNVVMTLGKLVAIRGDLVLTDPDWEFWDFTKLSEAVRQWVKRNPAVSNEKERDERKSIFHAREDEARVPSLLPIVINEISVIALSRGMTLNPKKCKEMFSSFLKYDLQCIDSIYISGTTVERVCCYKLLGVIISQDLTWNRHVD